MSITHSIQNKDYTILEPISANHVRFQFHGQFEGRTISWVVTLETLAHYLRKHPVTPHSQNDTARQCIHITSISDESGSAHILLALPTLREADIRKTIIMLRQYKNLQRGHHYYGPRYCITDSGDRIDYTEC